MCYNNRKNMFSKFISVFFGNHRKISHIENCGEVFPFSDNGLLTVISRRLPAGNVLIFPQTVVGAGNVIIFKSSSIVLNL